MNITIIFKDSTTVNFGYAYQIVNDGEFLIVNYEDWVEDEGDTVMTADSAMFALDDITIIVKGEVTIAYEI